MNNKKKVQRRSSSSSSNSSRKKVGPLKLATQGKKKAKIEALVQIKAEQKCKKVPNNTFTDSKPTEIILSSSTEISNNNNDLLKCAPPVRGRKVKVKIKPLVTKRMVVEQTTATHSTSCAEISDNKTDLLKCVPTLKGKKVKVKNKPSAVQMAMMGQTPETHLTSCAEISENKPDPLKCAPPVKKRIIKDKIKPSVARRKPKVQSGKNLQKMKDLLPVIVKLKRLSPPIEQRQSTSSSEATQSDSAEQPGTNCRDKNASISLQRTYNKKIPNPKRARKKPEITAKAPLSKKCMSRNNRKIEQVASTTPVIVSNSENVPTGPMSLKERTNYISLQRDSTESYTIMQDLVCSDPEYVFQDKEEGLRLKMCDVCEDDSLHSLLQTIDDVTTSRAEFLPDALKVNPIDGHFKYSFKDPTICSVVIDAAMVAAANAFLRYRAIKGTPPNLTVINKDSWESNSAVINPPDVPLNLNAGSDFEKTLSALQLYEIGHSISDLQVQESNLLNPDLFGEEYRNEEISNMLAPNVLGECPQLVLDEMPLSENFESLHNDLELGAVAEIKTQPHLNPVLNTRQRATKRKRKQVFGVRKKRRCKKAETLVSGEELNRTDSLENKAQESAIGNSQNFDLESNCDNKQEINAISEECYDTHDKLVVDSFNEVNCILAKTKDTKTLLEDSEVLETFVELSELNSVCQESLIRNDVNKEIFQNTEKFNSTTIDESLSFNIKKLKNISENLILSSIDLPKTDTSVSFQKELISERNSDSSKLSKSFTVSPKMYDIESDLDYEPSEISDNESSYGKFGNDISNDVNNKYNLKQSGDEESVCSEANDLMCNDNSTEQPFSFGQSNSNTDDTSISNPLSVNEGGEKDNVAKPNEIETLFDEGKSSQDYGDSIKQTFNCTLPNEVLYSDKSLGPSLEIPPEFSITPKEMVSNSPKSEVNGHRACIEGSTNNFKDNQFRGVSSDVADEERSYTYLNNVMAVVIDSKGQKRVRRESEDESDSDSEHSFKRKRLQQERAGSTEDLAENINQKSPKLLVPKFSTIGQVIWCIRDHCSIDNITKAIEVTKEYMRLSEFSERKALFENLFRGISNCINREDCPFSNDACMDFINETFGMFRDNELWDDKLCSLLISENLKSSDTVKHAEEVFEQCCQRKIPVHMEAVSPYVDSLSSSDTPLHLILKFLEYLIDVCSITPPKCLLHRVLKRFSRDSESTFSPPFYGFCKILRNINWWNVDCYCLEMHELIEFIAFCMKKGCWDQVARFFLSWDGRGRLLNCIAQAFAVNMENVAACYEKFVDEVYEYEGVLSSYLGGLLGQMGTLLMLEAHDRNDQLNAYKMLHCLHKYNFNYCEIQVHGGDMYLKEMRDSDNLILFSFEVAFKAMDICFQVARPKDGYQIFQSFSATGSYDSEVCIKYKIKQKRFEYLLAIIRLLQCSDPFDVGVKAFETLLSTFDQDSEGLNGFSEEITDVYNGYLVTLMNKENLDLVTQFYQYSKGPCNQTLRVRPHVLRGLFVLFSQEGKLEEANKIFLLGYVTNVYVIPDPHQDSLPRQMQVSTCWTSAEIKQAIKHFLEKLSMILMKKPPRADFDKWYSVKISFQLEVKEKAHEINCLWEVSNSIEEAVKRTCSILKTLETGPMEILQGFGEDNSFVISPNSIYQYWMQKHSSHETTTVAKSFKVPTRGRVSFGKSDSSLEGSDKEFCSPWSGGGSPAMLQNGPKYSVNVPNKISLNVTNKNNLKSPQNFHLKTPSPATGFAAELIHQHRSPSEASLSAKRKISFDSSPNFSPHTPELRTPPGSFDRRGDSSERVFQQASSNSLVHAGDRQMPSTPWLNNHRSPRKTLSSEDINNLENFRVVSKIASCSPQKPGFVGNEHQYSTGAQFVKSPAKILIASPRKVSPPQTVAQSLANSSAMLSSRKQPALNLDAISTRCTQSQQFVENGETLDANSSSEELDFGNMEEEFSKGLHTNSSAPKATPMAVMTNKTSKENNPIQNQFSEKEGSRTIQSRLETREIILKRKARTSNVTLENHSTLFSGFSEPPRSKLKSKRLATAKAAQTPTTQRKSLSSCRSKPPSFPLSTPSKFFKNIRPVTPILMASSLRARAPVSFLKSSKSIVTPIPRKIAPRQKISVKAKSARDEVDEDIENSETLPGGLANLKNFVISLPGNSSNRKVTPRNLQKTSESVNPHDEGAGGISEISVSHSTAKCSSGVVRHPRKLDRTGSASKVANPARVSHKVVRIPDTVKDAPQRKFLVGKTESENSSNGIKLHRTTCLKLKSISNVPNEEFQRVLSFLKIKVKQKCKLLQPSEQEARALNLAQDFVQNNALEKLDKRSMKLLTEFAEECI